MKEVNGYNISEQEFKKVSKWAEDVYNLAPVIKNLRNNADLLNAFFIDAEGNKN